MTSRLRDQAYATIAAEINAGRIPDGTRVSDRALAEQISLSRTPVREALIRLECEGLIESGEDGGYVVRQPNINELIDLFELRLAVEPYCAKMAAQRINDDQLSELQRLTDQLHEVAKVVRFGQFKIIDGELGRRLETADARFHHVIVSVGGNPYITRMLREQHVFSRVFGTRRYPPKRSPLGTVCHIWLHHQRILRALRNRDAQAAFREVEKHIADGLSMTRVYSDWLEQEYGGQEPKGQNWPHRIQLQIEAIEQS